MKRFFEQQLQQRWYGRAGILWLLWPLEILFRGIVAARRWAYTKGWLSTASLPVPVIVVGNITVGGAGKTPLVLWVVEQLRVAGYRPGIITRGYGGNSTTWPLVVTSESTPAQAGDEPVLLAQRANCPLVAGPDRVAAAEQLIAGFGIDVIVSDDGLQHYRLPRTVEICVLDGQRGLGNQHCLPVGPLREPASRASTVQMRVVNGGEHANAYTMQFQPTHAVNLKTGVRCAWADFTQPVHALAGIGHPERFFTMLEQLGLRVIRHPFPDHHAFVAADLQLGDERAILMTEKDAVKCHNIMPHDNVWCVPISAALPAAARTGLLRYLTAT